MKKKIISLVLCFALILTTGVVYGKTVITTQKAAGPKPVTINVGMWVVDSDTAGQTLWKGYQAKLKEKYPYITLKADNYTYSPDTFFPKAASGELPTVYVSYYTEASKIISAGYAKNISSFVKKYGYDRAMNPSLAKVYMKSGSVYGLPFSGYALGLYINMNLFKKAGLVDKKGNPKYPLTMAELAKDAQIIKQKTGKAGFFMPTKDHVGGWHFTQLAWNFGASFEVKKDGKWMSNMASKEVVAALQYVKDLKWKYNVLLPDALLGWGDWIKNFGTDQVGMVFAAADALINPVKDYKMSKDAIAMAPVPRGSKAQYSLLGGNAYLIAPNATNDQIDAVFKLFEVMGYSPKADPVALAGMEAEMKQRASEGQPVGLPGLPIWINKDRVKAENALYTKYRNVNYSLFKPYYDGAFKNVRAEEPVNCQDLYAELDNCLQQVLTDKNADPKTVLTAASKDFQTKFLDKVKN